MPKTRSPADDVFFVVLFVALGITLACTWHVLSPPFVYPAALAVFGALFVVIVHALAPRWPRAVLPICLPLLYLPSSILTHRIFPGPQSGSAMVFGLALSAFFVGSATAALVVGGFPSSPTGLSQEASMGLAIVVGAVGILCTLLGFAEYLRSVTSITWIALGIGILLLSGALSIATWRRKASISYEGGQARSVSLD